MVIGLALSFENSSLIRHSSFDIRHFDPDVLLARRMSKGRAAQTAP
jgi:hypothetical protein